MTKFPSIWGDITVKDESSIIPAKEEGKDDKAKDTTGADNKNTDDESGAGEDKPAEDDTDKKKASDDTTSSDDGAGKQSADKSSDAGDSDEEGDGYEYTEDDVDKAYGMLEEEGVLDLAEDDEFEATPNGLADAIAATVRNKLKKEIEAIPPVVQEFYSHIAEGKDVSSFTASKRQTSWSDYDITEEENQKVALKAFLLNQGMTDEEATEEVEDTVEAGKLEKKSTTAISSLTKIEESRADATAKAAEKKTASDAKAAQNDIKELQKTIDDLDELAGFPLDKARKTAFKDYIFKVNPRTGKTQMQENMNSGDRKMTIAFLDFINYTKADLEKDVASKLTKNRKKKLTRYTDKSVKNSNNSATVKTKTDAKKGTIKFPTIFGEQNIEVED